MVEPWTRIGDRLPTVGCTRLCQRVKPRQMALVAAMSKLLLIQLLNSYCSTHKSHFQTTGIGGCLQETAHIVPALIRHPAMYMVKLQMKVFQLLLQLDRDGSLRPGKVLGSEGARTLRTAGCGDVGRLFQFGLDFLVVGLGDGVVPDYPK